MGMVEVVIEVRGARKRPARVRFLVDSGAVYSVLPHAVWRALGLEPTRAMDFSLADGTPIRRQASECRFSYRGIVATSPVVLGEPRDAALLGMVTLETLGLVLNPFERTLGPMRAMLAACA